MFALLGFVGTVLVITVLIHLYLWKRLVRDPLRPNRRARRIAGFGLLFLGALIPLSLILRDQQIRWLVWPGYLWLSVMFYLLVIFAVAEIPMLVAKRLIARRSVGRRAAARTPEKEPVLVGAGGDPADAPPADPAEAPDPDRRLLLARGLAIFAGLTAVGVTGYGVRSALGEPVIRRVAIPLAKLDPRADGLRIALVSDIHLGPILGRAHTERIVNRVNDLGADLVAVVGDLVDGTVVELGPAAAPLADLRGRYGNYFVTGNHEYFSGYAEWVEEVDRLGLTPLRNERVEITHKGGVFDLAGVNDVNGAQYEDGPDFEKTMADRDPSRPVVLLAHQPVQAYEAARYGVDLQLSGHTHGGQIVPFNAVVRLQQPLVSGLGTVDGVPVYVTNGAGFWGPPVRVGAPPEITLVELRAR